MLPCDGETSPSIALARVVCGIQSQLLYIEEEISSEDEEHPAIACLWPVLKPAA